MNTRLRSTVLLLSALQLLAVIDAQALHLRAGGGARTFVHAPRPMPHPAPPANHQPPPGPHPSPPQPGPPPPGPPHPPPGPGPHPGPPPPPHHHDDDWYGIWAATAVVGTALAIGTVVAHLPEDCVPVLVRGDTYQQCGDTWYQLQSINGVTQYRVVTRPY